MRRLKHLTVRYIINRLLFWLDQNIHPDDPWMPRSAVNILDSWLKKSDEGVEWGSGRSTLWLAQHVGHLLSIEDNPIWYKRVSTMLGQNGITNVDYQFVPSTEAENVLQPYISAASNLPESSLQFALIDGKYRDLCALTALDKLAPLGLLIIDNIERYLPSKSGSPEAIGYKRMPITEYWQVFSNKVKSWRRIWVTNGVVDTCIWVKPHE